MHFARLPQLFVADIEKNLSHEDVRKVRVLVALAPILLSFYSLIEQC